MNRELRGPGDVCICHGRRDQAVPGPLAEDCTFEGICRRRIRIPHGHSGHVHGGHGGIIQGIFGVEYGAAP